MTKLLSNYFEEIVKVYDELFMNGKRVGEVEDNISTLHPETILTENYVVTLRKSTLERILKQIELRFCKQQGPKLC